LRHLPVDPELSVALLQHVVDENAARRDGAAVAQSRLTTFVDLARQGRSGEHLLIYTNQLLATVARRHSGVEGRRTSTAGSRTWN